MCIMLRQWSMSEILDPNKLYLIINEQIVWRVNWVSIKIVYTVYIYKSMWVKCNYPNGLQIRLG